MDQHMNPLGRIEPPDPARVRTKEIVRALRRFDESLTRELAVHRSQRAWRIMLLFRKLYTLLIREAPVKPVEAFRKLFTDTLDRYDIVFPSVWDFIPAEEISASVWKDEAKEPSYSVLILAIFEFEGRFARPQQLAAQFARNGHTAVRLSFRECHLSDVVSVV